MVVRAAGERYSPNCPPIHGRESYEQFMSAPGPKDDTSCSVPFEQLLINGIPAERLVTEKRTVKNTAITSYHTGACGISWEVVPSRAGWHIRFVNGTDSPLNVRMSMIVLPEQEGRRVKKEYSKKKESFKLSKGNFKLQVLNAENVNVVTDDYSSEPFLVDIEGNKILEVYAGYERKPHTSFRTARRVVIDKRARACSKLGEVVPAISRLEGKYRQAIFSDLHVLSAHQHKTGCVSASTSLCNDDYVKSWGRDAYFVWKARESVLDAARDRKRLKPLAQEQRDYERFLVRAQIKGPFKKEHRGFWHQKLQINGKPAKFIWEDWSDNGKQWQPDDQLCYPASITFSKSKFYDIRKRLAKRRSASALKRTIPKLARDGFPHPFECDNSWEDKFQKGVYPKPYSAIVSFLEAGNSLKKNASNRQDARTGDLLGRTAYRELVKNFYVKKNGGSGGGFEGFCRNALDTSNPYDSAVLYVDPILDYLDGIRDSDPQEARDGILRVQKTLEHQLNYDAPIKNWKDPGLTQIVGGKKRIIRYNGDAWDGKRSWPQPPRQNPWPLASLTASYSLLKLSNVMRAGGDRAGSEKYYSLGKRLLDSTLDMTYIPEQLDSKTGARVSSTPLAWAHAMRVLSIMEL